ncbi:MAG: CHAT domain-containing protein [Bacteroidales bacterium]|nr:CHAT domain-containing protein [Bacteroidales bacterium]
MNRLIISIITCLLTIIPASAQNLSEAELKGMLNRATALQNEGKYSEAINIFSKVVKYTNKQSTEIERQVHVLCQILISSCYYNNRQYSEGYKVAKNMLDSNLNDDEKKLLYNNYVDNGYQLASSLMVQDENGFADYNQARTLLQELMPYASGQRRERILSNISLTWLYEGADNHCNEKFEDAIKCYENARNGFSELGQVANEIFILKKTASINAYLGDKTRAIILYEQALSLAQKSNKDVEKMEIMTELCHLNNLVGNMEKKELYTQQIEELFNSTNNIEVYYIYYTNKGKEAQSVGRNIIAEQWLQKAIDIAKKQTANGNNSNLLLAYLHLGELYHAEGRHEEAYEYLYLSLGTNTLISKDNYLTYIRITEILLSKGEMQRCLEYLNELSALEQYINEPRQLSKLYMVRGSYFTTNKQYASAVDAYKKADEILASKYPAADGERARLYALIGGVEHKLGHNDESEHYYKLYADAIKEIYGEQSLKYINSQIYLANAQGFAGHIDDGCKNYTSAVATLKELIRKRIPYMNTAERESFWSPLSSLLTHMTPYALKAELYQTEYTQTCYDALLLSKAFLLDSERSLYDIVQQEGDETDKQTYMRISSMNNKIKEWEKNYAQYADSILVASNKIARFESTLMKKCKSIGDITSFMDVNYNAVKKTLERNDVLIDFTDFVPNTGDRRYVAYIVNEKQKYPLLKPLFAESQIDSLGIVRPDMFYDIEDDIAADVIKLLWNPIKEYITEGSTVYYVPSQMLFQVCLESLPLDDGTLLGDHYNFVRLSSARELVKKQNSYKHKASSAVLYGGLQYDLEPNIMAENAKQYDLSALMVKRGGGIVRGDSIFRELPGSKLEVEKITEVLKQSNFKVTPYMGMNGTEESFLNMHGKSPRILHLATHGFYYTPTEAEEVNYLKGYSDAMLLSGLIMAGGNAAWRGKKLPEGTLGGILTANNIARLDLSGTDMVVLSACQTGQGKATAEGLYGLQRAFKKAGVGTMVMTLWSVSDKVATEFMIKFYESLAENGWNKHKAFEQAKSYIRTQHPDPYHWAAFVMLY